MPALSSGDQSAIRSRPIGRRWKLYVFQPTLLWYGEVTGSPAQGDKELSVTTQYGSPSAVLPGMTCRVTDAGGSLKIYPSKVRFKGYTAGTLTVAENAIDWQAGDVVAAYRLFELWPRVPYIDPSDGTQYKDGDVAYTDDYDAQRPKANAGPAAVATLAGGYADVVFQDMGSYACPGGGTVTGHLWTPIGGSPSVVGGGLSTSTVTLRYTSAGYHYVKYGVTDGNGVANHVYVPVLIDDGTKHVTRVVPGDRYWSGSGWEMSRRLITLLTTAYDNILYDGAPLFLVADDDQVAAGAFAPNRANLRWSGWLVQDNLDERTAHSREISYRAVSTAHVLANVPAFPTGLRSAVSPSDWYEYSDLSINSVVHILLDWHSTVFQVCDYHPFVEEEWMGQAGARARPGENCKSGSLLDQVNAVLAAARGDLRCDRQGVLRATRHEWFLSDAEQAARATVLTLQNGDFMSVRYGPHPHRATVSQVRASGVDGNNNPFISGAPGAFLLDGGQPSESDHLAPRSQSELDQWTGQLLAFKNWDAIVTLQMAGEYDCVDPAYGDLVAGLLKNFDPRIPNGPYSVVGVRFEDHHDEGYTLGEWLLLPRPGMYGAQARPIPVSPPPPPPPPPDPPEDVPEVLPAGTGDVVVVGTVGAGVCYSLNAISGSPSVWGQLNTGLSDTSFIESLVWDPLAPSFKLACIDGSGEVYINTNWRGGGSWALALDEATALAMVAGVSNVSLIHLAAKDIGGVTYLFCVALYGAKYTGQIRVLYSTDWGSTWGIYPFASFAFGTYYSCAQCKMVDANYGQYIRVFKKSDSLSTGSANGQLIVSDDGLLILSGASYTGALSRPNAVALDATLGASAIWTLPIRVFTSCTTSPYFCFPSDNLNWVGTIGGDKSAGNAYTGPGGACLNAAGDHAYFGAWRHHHDDDGSEEMGFAKISVPSGALSMLSAIDDGWGYQRGMLTRPPLESALNFIALYVNGDDETELYVHDYTTPKYIFGTPLREVRAFPALVDGYAILYAGRSHVSGERASSGDEALFYVSKLALGIIGEGWTDKTSNLYDLGARGITDVVFDTESD